MGSHSHNDIPMKTINWNAKTLDHEHFQLPIKLQANVGSNYILKQPITDEGNINMNKSAINIAP